MILSRRRGALSQLARDLGLSRVTVHQVIRGRSQSERVMKAAEERALALLEEEKTACLKKAS